MGPCKSHGTRAGEMRTTEAVNSSAWVILGAASDNGMSKMKQLKKVPTATGVKVEGIPGALIDLSNAMLEDPRIVHINDNSFLQVYSEQALFEAEMDGVWLTGSAKEVIADAPERQRKEGWASVRAAISTTVRMWILRGYMALGGRDDGPAAIKDYSQALEVLEWGRQAWRDVKKEDRGIIFDDQFFRGVRSIYLQALMTAERQASGNDAEDLLNTILEEAQDMLRDISSPETALPEGIYDPGFVSSFVLYPRGRALSMVGYYHNHIARQLVLQKNASAFEHFTKAACAYFEAGQMYPEDDELHAWFLHSGLVASKLCGCPISEALPIFEKIRLAIPKMKPIWEYSGLAHTGRDGALQEDVKNEESLRKALQEGRLTPDDFILPEPLQFSL
ncbi:uncharacterized protein LAESUDRAFT_184545 [Laetiporus sulphureus 93-53]|uniref:Uncharacterized protein n=1 Tax=Laetiporus sulphureus 93-53 TaxID=1314785 RepID=A0A165E493_9APHY|nr:uncharacterized protein LAESUDRAFT_184545 [Laetiporus sulphureus 93-53]KZT06216.1 hypothetical protein LAESUDRAFT_184545 [Laetiporus sulphureus 93-53]